MWPTNSLTELLSIKYPVLQAGMAGGPTTPSLIAAVSNAGGLGILGAGYMTPDQIRSAILEIRNQTSQPFGVNLFIPGDLPTGDVDITPMNQHLNTYRRELQIEEEPKTTAGGQDFLSQLQVIIDLEVPIFSFTFGMPSEDIVQTLKSRSIKVIGTATTVGEACALESRGVDAIVAQGSEAGGHRGTFAVPFESAMIGTMALIPQIVDSVKIPVIASGGIMDGRGISASLMLGASGVQMGTAFLTSRESGAHPKHKESIVTSSGHNTVVTKMFSGKPARGLTNRFTQEMEAYIGDVLPYPVQNSLTRDIRQAASKQNRPEFMSLWAGQGAPLAEAKPAAELLSDWVRQVDRLLTQKS